MLKALSLFVIVTFLATQCDLQLALANMVTSNPAAVAAQGAAEAGKTDKIHYMQNFDDLQDTLQGQAGENPLSAVSPDQATTKKPFSGDLPQEKSPDLSTTFLNGVSPILGAENKTVEMTTRDPQNPDIVTVTYQDGTSFTYNSNPSSNKILVIRDLTKPRIGSDGKQAVDAQGKPVYDLETRRFDWGGVDSGTGAPYVRIVTEGENGALSTYQKFVLTPVQPDGSGGELGRMLESGYWVPDPATNQNVEVLTTRDDGTRVTIYDRTADPSYYIERTYEKLPEGENRLLSYRKISVVDGQALATIDLEIKYDSENGLVRIVDRSVNGTTPSASVNFWEYKLIGQNERGELLAVGEMDRVSGQVNSRMDISATTYTITYPQAPDQKLVFERLPNGGFGRILRYRLGDLDLEYRYETLPATEQAGAQETVTVLDYHAGTFLKMGFVPGTVLPGATGLIDSPQNVIAAGTFSWTATTPSFKNLLTRVDNTWVVTDPNDSRIFEVYQFFPDGTWSGVIRSRGPPEPGSQAFVDIRYEYDLVNRRVTAYDVTNQRYALYDWKDPQTPRLLEQGDIAVDVDGNILSRSVTKAYNAEILGPVAVPSTEYESEIAFASAVSALQSVPGIDASGIGRSRIITDPDNPDRLTVVLTYENTEYFYTYNVAAQASLLSKMRIPAAGGGFRIVEYDAEGRVTSESTEATDGTLTLLVTYRYEKAGEVIIIDHRAHTLRVAVFNADKTIGQTLRSGFFNDAEKTYSVQGAGETESKWYAYGADGVMLTSDDVASSRPTRGPEQGTAPMRRGFGSSENPDLDRKIQALRSLMREYQSCSEEGMRSEWRFSRKCEDLLGSASGLQKDIENEQYRTSGGIGARGAAGSGSMDLNYHNPSPAPAYIAALAGLGSAPIDNPNAVIVDNADGSKTISLNGLVEIWRAGAGGWGRGNDVLVQATETASTTTWYYTNGRADRVTTMVNGVETELARYEYSAAGTVAVIQANGARYEYSYTDESDPFGSAELVSARYEKDGAWVTQSYSQGRLSSVCDGSGANCTTYQYDAGLNQATLTSATGTRILALGGDGKLGTVDDYLVGGTDTGLEVQQDDSNRILRIVDLTYGTVTRFSYDGTQVNVATEWASGRVINDIQLDLGADNVFGTADDRLLYMSGFQNGHIFAETFDAQGHVTSVEGYFEVARQDADGRYLRADGTIAMTEQEAAKDLVHQRVIYTWTSAPAADVSKLPADKREGALDWTLVVATYTVTGPNQALQEKRGYKIGADGLFGTADDILTSVEAYDPVTKVRFEMNYDDQGRVTLYRNLDSGDELRYTYDDTAKKVTVTSSENYFKQIYQYDEAHPGDFQYARLIEEERDGIIRKWDENEQLISTTDDKGVEIKTPSGHKVTSVTDKDGITTFYQDGVILSVVRKDGTVLRTYTHVVDPVTGELKDVDFEGKNTLPKTTICLSGETSGCSNYRVVYENGVILEYQMKDARPVLVWVGDPLGAEFTQSIDEATGGMTVRYNDGRTNFYSQIAGFYEILRGLNLRGEEETYCYYGKGMSAKCSEIDTADLTGKIQAAIDALKNTGVDTGTSEFKAPELKADDPGLDYSVRKDGTVVFYAPRDKAEWQETPNTLYSIGEFGHVTIYQYDTSRKLTQTLEMRADGTLSSVTQYDTDSRVSASYRYNPDGKKILSYSVYSYYSTDSQSKDFRLLKLVETYSVGDLEFSLLKDLMDKKTGVGADKPLGSLESRVHYLPRHAEATTPAVGEKQPVVTEAELGRYDYLGIGLVDFTENFRRPLEAGGEPVFLSSVKQDYSVFQLVRSVTYKNLAGTTSCGEGFSGCEITSLDEFTYLPGTTDVDFTKRYWVSGNSIENKVLQSVFRTEQVDDYTSVTHDFGKDFTEDTVTGGDDKFTVQVSVTVGDDLDGDSTRAEWGTEVREYADIKDVGFTHKDGYKEAYRAGAFTDPESHSIQYDVNGDGSVTRTKAYKFVRGVETPEISYSESVRYVGSEPGYEGTLADSLLGDLTGASLDNFRGQEFSFTRTWKFGFDREEEDRIFKAESYSVTSRDEMLTRTVSRDVATDLLTYTDQRRIPVSQQSAEDAAVRQELLGAGGLVLTSDKDMFESRSYAGGFDTEQLFLDHSFSLDVYGDGTLTRTKNFKVENGAETGEISYSETEDVARNTISYDGTHTIGELMLGPTLGSDRNWAEEHVSRTQTWGVSFEVNSADRLARHVPPYEGESYQITSADGKITRSANWDAVKGEIVYNYVEQVKVPYDTTTINGIHVGDSLLGDVKGDKNWSMKSVLYMTSSRDAFNVEDRFIDSESFQVTSRDRKETRTLSVNRHDPDGPRVSYSSSVRTTRSEIQALLDDPKITILPADREMFMKILSDPAYEHNAFSLVTGSSDAFNVPKLQNRDRVITSKAYQVTSRDGDTTHSLMVDDRVPEGYPVVAYQRQERMKRSDIEAILADPANTLVPPGTTVLDSGKTLAETLLEALKINPYATFFMTTSNYYVPEGATQPRAGSTGYSWSTRDGNSNYSIGINEAAPDGSEMTFTQTQKVSHQAALDIANKIADPAKRAQALAAIGSDPMTSISMSLTGLADPVYQWTSSLDSNVSFVMSVNNSVPVGVDNAPTGTEISFSRNVRVSRAEVVAKIGLISNEELRNQELARLAASPNSVYFTRQESIAGDPDASYQWSALGDPNNSFTLTLNSHVPSGIPDASGTYPKTKTEASLSVNTRVSRAVALGYINSDANGDWIANPEDRAAALAAYNAAVALGTAFYQARSGIGDPVLQWTVASDPNTSFSLQAKDNAAAGWHSTLFSFNKRVSQEAVTAQYKDLPAGDSRRAALEEAITRGELFYMSMSDRGPTYQWSDTENKNFSYSLSLDAKFPSGSGFLVPPALTFTTNARVSTEEALADFDLIQDPARRAEAKSKLGAAVPVYRALTDGASSIDGVDAVYQFSDAANADTNYTVSLRSGVPVGDPAANTGREATFGISMRVSQQEIRNWLNDAAITLIAQGTTPAEALQYAEVFYLSKGSATEPGQYQWTGFADPNKSYSLQVRADLKQKTLSVTTQVSAASVAAELAAAVAAGTITADDSRKQKIEDAIADGLTFFRTEGDKGPNYQWASDSDKNMNYSLAVDTLFPVGDVSADGTYANHRTELSITVSVRASIVSLLNQLSFIADEKNREEARERLLRAGVTVSRSVTDGVSALDGVDPAYQFGDPSNPDVNYSVSLRSGVPAGIPDASGKYSETKTEAAWGISTRVSKETVARWLSEQGMQIINNGVDITSALSDTAMYSLSQSGTKDPGQYQWSSISDPTTSFSLQVRDAFKQVTVNVSTQVSEQTVVAELAAAIAAGTITDTDSRKKAIESALADGKLFYRSTGDQGPTYQWSSETDKNRSFSLGVDKNFPAGLPDPQTGRYTSFRTELSLTTSDRVSAAFVSQLAGSIKDTDNLAEARAKLALSGVAVTRSVTDGVLATDGVDATYQFVDPQDPDTNYSLAVRSQVPVGDPPVNTGIDVTWNISQRVAPAAALLDLKKFETDPARIAAFEAALANADAVYLSKAGTSSKERQYQWTRRYDPNDPGASNTSYSLTLKDLHSEALFTVSTQVSTEAVTGQIAMLDKDLAARKAEIEAEIAKPTTTVEQKTALAAALATLIADRDAKRSRIQAAIVDGRLFTRQETWSGDPSYSWSSNSNANVNYGLSVNPKVPVGLRDPATGNYTSFRSEISFTRSERTSFAVITAQVNRIEDAQKKAEALAAIGLTEAGGGAFTSVSTDGRDPVIQWANPKNPDETWSLSVNNHVPNGTEANPLPYTTEMVFTHSVRVSKADVAAFVAQIADPTKRSEALAALETGRDFYRSQAGDDDPVYQWSQKDNSGVSFTVTLNNHVPSGMPDASGNYTQFTSEVVFAHNERTSLQEMLTLISVIVDPVKQSQAYLSLFDAEIYSRSKAGNDDPSYQWASLKDLNVSYTLSRNPRLDTASFTRTKRVSQAQVAAELGSLTINYNTEKAAFEARISAAAGSEKAVLEAALARLTSEFTARSQRIGAALADAKGGLFYMNQAGSDDPSYQWTSASNKNLNYTLSVNSKVPVGESGTAGAGFKTELTFSLSERASVAEARSKLGLIRDTEDRAEAQAALEAQAATAGSAIYRSLTDTDSVLDYIDPSYQFTDVTNPDKSYSIALNSSTPGRILEANWSISTRIGRAQVAAALQDMTDGYNTAESDIRTLIAAAGADTAKVALLERSLADLTANYQAKLASVNAALLDGDSFSMSQAGSNDPARQYQWVSRTNANVNYSLNVKADWHEATFSRMVRVSAEDVAKQFSYLKDTRDSRFANLQLALIDSRVFMMTQSGNDDPSYQWSSETNRNLSYSMSVNSKTGVGIPDAQGVYPSTKTEVTFTRNERVLTSDAQGVLALIGDPDQRAAATAALAQSGVTVFKALTDAESAADFSDPVFQFSNVTNSDINYSIAIRSGIPVGELQADGTYPETRTEAVWSISERVSRDSVRQNILADKTGEWISDPAKRSDALAALADGEVFTKTYAGPKDNVTYQWTSRTNPNVNYSLLTKASWHEATFSRTRRVSRAEVEARFAYLKDTGDSRYAGLQTALADADGTLFYMTQAGNDDPSIQWTSVTDRNSSYSLAVNSHVPCDAAENPALFKTEVTFTRSFRETVEQAAKQAQLIVDPSDRAEALMALAKSGTVVFRTLTDGESAGDGVDPVYQFADVANPDKNYSMAVRSGVPTGNPPVNTAVEAAWNVTERISKNQVKERLTAAWISNAEKLADALAALENGDVFMMSYAGENDKALGVTYQWTNRSNQNINYSLQVKETWQEAAFSKTERVSHEKVAAELARLAATDSRYAALQANLADGKIFYVSSAGKDQPSYQWASETDRNRNYALALSLVNGGIQLTVTTTERMSVQFVRSQTGLIQDASDKADMDAALAKEGLTIYRTITDGESSLDGNAANPVYSFTDPSNVDRSYSISVNADAPDGAEATVNITTRISRAQVEQHIKADATGEWVQDPVKRAQALAALADGDLFSMTQSGTDDTPQYQWSSLKNTDVNYSLQVKNDWHQSIFSRTERVATTDLQGVLLPELTTIYTERQSEIQAMIDELAAKDAADPQIANLQAALATLTTNYTTQKGLLEAAAADGEMVYRTQTGNDDPSYQWSSRTDRNKSYSLAVNTHIPVGQPDASGNYTRFRTEFTVTSTQRVSRSEVDASGATYNLIQDLTQKDPAKQASLEQGIIVYKATTDGKEPVYQWSSTLDTNVSYSLALDTHVPVGTAGGEMTVANFTRTERVSRAAMTVLLNAIKNLKCN